MSRIRLIIWNEDEARQRAKELRAVGYHVRHDLASPPELVRALRSRPPDAIVIDLSRLPSQGRDMGLLLRKSAALRQVPLVFVGGSPEKARAVRQLLPDATFATWGRIEEALRRALAHPPKEPVVPSSLFAPYAGKSLPLKLGLKTGMRVALVAAPPDLQASLRPLPERVVLTGDLRREADLILWFVRTAADLHGGIQKLLARSGTAPIWIAWAKKASGAPTDLSQVIVRAAGLEAGLVDYKICSVDATWSALLFKKR
jgi:CheY-like chemotaxis protein